ncbi:hypothetical protein QUA56_15165 [Microcoleus sp. N3A4]
MPAYIFSHSSTYALDSRRAVEVVPTVTLKKLHSVPEYIPGLFN